MTQSLHEAEKTKVAVAPAAVVGKSFQDRVHPWLMQCFGAEIAADTVERNHRFLEEALELVQSTGCTQSEAHQLVDYVFGRPVGESFQEVGGVMVTLAALCLAKGIGMYDAAGVELERIWGKVEAIREKQAAKPKHSPLPMALPEPAEQVNVASRDQLIEGLQKIKIRLHFMGWPAEAMWNAGTPKAPHWIPDWRYEIQLIEHLLHGSAITTPERPQDTVPAHSIPAAIHDRDAKTLDLLSASVPLRSE